MAVQAQSQGQIVWALARIRKLIDDPSARTKFSDTHLLDLLNECWTEVLTDLYNVAENVPSVNFDITLVADQSDYMLPASIGEITRVVQRDDNGLVTSELIPRGLLNPWGHGFRIHGNTRIVFNPAPTAGETISVEYIPSGDVLLHRGSAAAGLFTVNSVNIKTATILEGALDRRPNAYLGYVIALLCMTDSADSDVGDAPGSFGAFPVQERIISTVDFSSGITLGVSPDFDFDPSAEAPDGYFRYEIYPAEAPLVWPCLCYYAAAKLAATEKKTAQYKLMLDLFEKSKRATALRWTNAQSRAGKAFETDTPEAYYSNEGSILL